MIHRPRRWLSDWWSRLRNSFSDEERARSLTDIPSGLSGAGEEATPLESFLDALRVAFAAARIAVWLLEGEVWVVERETRTERTASLGGCALEAAGHPFTWSLREGLLLQLSSEDLFGSGVGWSLVGGPAGPGRVLCISFEGPPGPSVRPALGPALRHLRALYRARVQASGRGSALGTGPRSDGPIDGTINGS
ncbi:MAG: hypothetical protein ACE5JR_02320 [Gemmatimonadota bacterium]